MDAIANSHFTLAFAMGMVLYIGLLHLWLWRRRSGGVEHFWVAAWCAASLAYQLARYLQLEADGVATAVTMARAQGAAVPMLVFSLVEFARSLAEPQRSARFPWRTFAPHFAVSVVALTTGFFHPGDTASRTDWFGRPFIGVTGGPNLFLYLPYIGWAFGVVLRSLRRAHGLEVGERRVLIGGLASYVTLGVISILSASEVISSPQLTQYGPLVVAMSLNHLLVNRHRRLLTELEEMVTERTAEIGLMNHSLEAQLQELTAARDAAASASSRLAESEARYRELVEHAPLGVIAWDERGRVLTANTQLVAMMGAPSRQAVMELDIPRPTDGGRSASAGDAAPGGRSARAGDAAPGTAAGDALADLLAGGLGGEPPPPTELSYTSVWGRHAQLRVHVASLRDADGDVTGVQALVEDITEARDLQQRLRQSQKVEAVGRMAAGIAHEINNPMAYVRTNLALLRTELDGAHALLDQHVDRPEALLRFAECLELVDESLEGVERTIDIVRDVKELTHGGDGTRGGEHADLRVVLDASLRVAALGRPPGIRVESDLDAAPRVACGAGQLQQVFVNLIVNALQAVGEAGTVRVSARAEAALALVLVADDGPGISREVQERLFDPFFTTKPAGQGTGLGLTLAHEIVRIQGGEIRVTSRDGEGTTFEVRLPAVDAGPAEEAPRERGDGEAREATRHLGSAAKAR